MTANGSYQELLPHLQARRAVETVWVFKADQSMSHLVLPDGRMDIIIRHSATDQPDRPALEVILAGPTDRTVLVQVKAHEGYVGLRLHPGRAGCFGFDAALVAHKTLVGQDVLDLLPSLAAVLKHPPGLDGLGNCLQRWLVAHLADKRHQPPRLVLSVLDAMHQTGGRERIDALALDHRVSGRTIHRMFQQWVGLSPKALSSVLQFHRCLRLLEAGLSSAHAAHEAGYADQSHMIRQFNEMGGFSPAHRPPLTVASLPIPH